MNDLRVPIGSFFLILGVILLIAAFALTNTAPLAPANVDLYSGITMVVFGGIMLWLARRAS
jgi:hypothetical protein